MKYFCKCGMRYSNHEHLRKHIAMHNLHHPKVMHDAEHAEISKSGWEAQFTPWWEAKI